MATRLIELEDGLLIEVAIDDDDAKQISSSMAKRVSATFEKIQPVLIAVAQSISNTWQTVAKEVEVEKATVELGLAFEAEGNIFITKATSSSNLTVTLTISPKEKDS